ncbi:MAG: hypothetical protein E6Q61_05500 [Nitrosomonas sp.]|nr:MAG: hypothetical protein E6Q61_05500 [Nitrosomonas sp.]
MLEQTRQWSDRNDFGAMVKHKQAMVRTSVRTDPRPLVLHLMKEKTALFGRRAVRKNFLILPYTPPPLLAS